MVPGLVGGYVGKEHGLDLEKSGNYTDEEIKEKAGKRGALVGAAVGAPMGLVAAGSGLAALNRLNPEVLERIKFKKGGKWNKAALAGALAGSLISGGVWSGAGSYLGAKKNISDRIEQRDKFEGIARNQRK